MSELSPVEKIQRNAELVIETMREQGVDLDYDQKSVEWLDGYIERQRQQNPNHESNIYGLSNTLGSFLGECIRRQFGGEWAQSEYGWAIAFDEKNACFPFNKVEKQLRNGAVDSIAGFYGSIPALYGNVLRVQSAPSFLRGTYKVILRLFHRFPYGTYRQT